MNNIDDFLKKYNSLIIVSDKLKGFVFDINKSIWAEDESSDFSKPPEEITEAVSCKVHGVEISINDDIDRDIEMALYNALKIWKDEIPKFQDSFQTIFRQMDVIQQGKGAADILIYHLLNKSKLFWKLFHIELDNTKVGQK